MLANNRTKNTQGKAGHHSPSPCQDEIHKICSFFHRIIWVISFLSRLNYCWLVWQTLNAEKIEERQLLPMWQNAAWCHVLCLRLLLWLLKVLIVLFFVKVFRIFFLHVLPSALVSIWSIGRGHKEGTQRKREREKLKRGTKTQTPKNTNNLAT